MPSNCTHGDPSTAGWPWRLLLVDTTPSQAAHSKALSPHLVPVPVLVGRHVQPATPARAWARTPLAAPGAPCVPRAIAGSPPSHQRRRTPWLLSRQSEEGEPGGALSRPRKEQGTRAPCLPPPEPGSLCLAASVQAGEAEQAVPGRRGLACVY